MISLLLSFVFKVTIVTLGFIVVCFLFLWYVLTNDETILVLCKVSEFRGEMQNEKSRISETPFNEHSYKS